MLRFGAAKVSPKTKIGFLHTSWSYLADGVNEREKKKEEKAPHFNTASGKLNLGALSGVSAADSDSRSPLNTSLGSRAKPTICTWYPDPVKHD